MPGCGHIVWCIKPTVPSWHLVSLHSASSGHITSSIEKFILVTVLLAAIGQITGGVVGEGMGGCGL